MTAVQPTPEAINNLAMYLFSIQPTPDDYSDTPELTPAIPFAVYKRIARAVLQVLVPTQFRKLSPFSVPPLTLGWRAQRIICGRWTPEDERADRRVSQV